MLLIPGSGNKGKADGQAVWMITLADLLSLLVAFFALLYATTAIAPQKWKQVVEPIAMYMGGRARTNVPVAAIEATRSKDPNYAAAVLQQLIDTDPRLSGVTIDRDDHGLTLTFPLKEDLHADLAQSPSAIDGLARIIGNLQAPVTLRVEAQVMAEENGDAQWWVEATKNAEIATDVFRNAGVAVVETTGMVAIGVQKGSHLIVTLREQPDGDAR